MRSLIISSKKISPFLSYSALILVKFLVAFSDVIPVGINGKAMKIIDDFKKDIVEDKLEIEEILIKYYLENEAYFFKSVVSDSQAEYKIKREIVKQLNVFQRDIVLVGSGKLGFSLAPSIIGNEVVNYSFPVFTKRSDQLVGDTIIKKEIEASKGILIEAGSCIKSGSILFGEKITEDQVFSKKVYCRSLVVLKSESLLSSGSIIGLGSDLDFAIVSDTLFERVGSLIYENLQNGKINKSNWKKYGTFCEYYFKGWIRPDLLPNDFLISVELGKYLAMEAAKYNIDSINIAIYKNWKFFFYYHEKNLKKIKTKLITM